MVHKWLLAHPGFTPHFTPTYSSWINQVERWFTELQRRRLERGVFCSLDDLKTALSEWIKIWNAAAGPFKWTKTADQICHYCDRISGPTHYALCCGFRAAAFRARHPDPPSPAPCAVAQPSADGLTFP
ncbi:MULTISPECIES: hypothetical protein [unclassified Streptomyces]|uniref:hypothetical protein n=1 Tax=unclassified Streptomyces TaxID=2593676 RepID=UPI002DD8632E|nr:hypothetical protein [Streptomyces sp. NBC_01445]WSE02303.1 transposase [Streptomyces sp. NBC_01445]